MHRPSGPFGAIVLPFVCLPLVFSCSSGGGSSTTTVGVGPGSTTTTLSLSPQSGAVGTLLQITGQGFDLVATNNKIEFTGGALGLAEIATATTILTRVPSGAVSGPVKVVAAGKAQLSGKFSVLPSITAVAPAKAAVGSIFSVQGNGFDIENLANNRVTISGQEAIPTDVTPSFLNAQVPIGAKSGPVEVLVGGVSAIGSANLVVPPSILSFSPEEGLIGTPVTIQGFGFSENLNANAVKFNGVQAVVASATYFTIETQVPPGSSTGPITVTVSGETAVGAVDFAVNLPPIVSGFSPGKGVKGSTISVLGQNFNGNPSKNQVDFGGYPATVLAAVPTKLDVIVPAAIPDQTPPLFVTVKTNAGTATSSTPFDVDYPPTIDDFYPKTGLAGATLAIDGTNFSTIPANNTVTIGGVAASVVGASLDALVVTIPQGGAAGPVQVTTADGVATSADNFQTYSPRFAYVSNSGDNSVSSYIVDEASGKLRHNGYVFLGAAKSPRSIAASSDGKMLYVANFSADEVAQYSIGDNGVPVPFAAPSVSAGDGPTAIAVHPNGQYVWVLNQTPATISQYTTLNGNLIPQVASAISTGGSSPTTLTLDPAGKNLYATNIASGTVAMFSIGDDGLLTSNGVVGAGPGSFLLTGPSSVLIHPNGEFAYVSNSNDSKIYIFVVESGIFSPLLDGLGAPVTVAAGTGPVSLSFDAEYKFLYAANRTSSDLSIFQVDSVSGLISPLGSFALPAVGTSVASPVSILRHANSLYSLASGTTEVVQVSVDGSTGQVSLANQSRSRATGSGIAFAPGATPAKFSNLTVQISKGGALNSEAFALDALGTPSSVGIANSAAGGTAPLTGIAIQPQGQFYFLGLLGTTALNGTYAYATLDSLTGAPGGFTPVQLTTGTAPNQAFYNAKALEVDKSGRFLIFIGEKFSATPTTSHISNVTIDQTSGGFSGGNVPNLLPAAGKAQSLALEPSGRYGYVANPGTSNVQGVSINVSAGTLTSAQAQLTTGAGTFPYALAAHPSGRFLFAGVGKGTSALPDFVRTYLIGATGQLTLPQDTNLGAAPFTDSGSSIAVDALGRFLFVLLANGDIQTWAVSSSGALSGPITNTIAQLAGNTPYALAADATGSYLFVTNAGGAAGENLVVCAIAGDGSLSFAASTPTVVGAAPKGVAVNRKVE